MGFLPPCSHACPAGEDIQAWLDLAQDGPYEFTAPPGGKRVLIIGAGPSDLS